MLLYVFAVKQRKGRGGICVAEQPEKFRIAVIDDQQNYLDDLCKNLDRYAQEHHCEFSVQSSTGVIDFVSDYPHGWPDNVHLQCADGGRKSCLQCLLQRDAQCQRL